MSRPGYPDKYSAGTLWAKLARYAKVIGRELAEKVLWLYYVLQDPTAPRRAKAIALGALGYFVFPVDLIPDLLPLAGYSDDATVVAAALAVLYVHVTPEIRAKTDAKLREWFG